MHRWNCGESMSGLLGNTTSVENADLRCSTAYPSARMANGRAGCNYTAACKAQWMECATSALTAFSTEGEESLTRKGVNEILSAVLTSGNLII